MLLFCIAVIIAALAAPVAPLYAPAIAAGVVAPVVGPLGVPPMVAAPAPVAGPPIVAAPLAGFAPVLAVGPRPPPFTVVIHDGFDSIQHPARSTIRAVGANKSMTFTHVPVNAYNDVSAVQCFDHAGESVGMVAARTVDDRAVRDTILAMLTAGTAYAATYLVHFKPSLCRAVCVVVAS